MTDTPNDEGTPQHEPLIEHDPTVLFAPGAESIGEEAEPRLSGAFGYALVIEGGPTAGMAYVLGYGETLAGRSEHSDIFLGDVTVSRDHARFIVDESGLRVIDSGSTNGTYVNDERVGESALRPGDQLFIGKFRLRVTSGTAAG